MALKICLKMSKQNDIVTDKLTSSEISEIKWEVGCFAAVVVRKTSFASVAFLVVVDWSLLSCLCVDLLPTFPVVHISPALTL